jgi:DNA-binding transcriptional LysR family regulator
VTLPSRHPTDENGFEDRCSPGRSQTRPYPADDGREGRRRQVWHGSSCLFQNRVVDIALQLFFSDIALLKRFPLLTIDLIPVVAPDHTLAALEGPIDTHVLNRHVQLVLTDRSPLTAGRDYGVLSGRAWRLADLGAKHSMLLAGLGWDLGWGNMPSHLVQNDIAQGRLKVIRPVEFESRGAQLAMCGAYLADHRLGPAGQWMIDHLSAVVGS